ncbi:3-hydroxy acid dehydrogenase [Malassezia nana]|uniref:3-hydroxy acid dehydrogenase n=1 Tax=Malassezia nana TaxID=180528 RepID=A0AAF0J3I2_9BASI|nr:3-hydroxy acid dehydrogenase [Malassezia nana]
MSVFSSARLHDKVVLVTGASSGIGAAAAKLFARAGANVVIAARRAEKLAEVQAACQEANKAGSTGHGGQYATISLDIRSNESLDTVLQRLPPWASNVDVLVNNAGLAMGTAKVGEIRPEDLDAMFETNVRGLIYLTQLYVRQCKERRAGHIINIGSIAGLEPYPGGSVYCATKFAVRSFTEALMKELVDTPIRVTNVQPGMVETEFSLVRYYGDKKAADKVYDGIEALTADDIAEEIVWAASRPPHVNVAETLVLPVNQAGPFHVARSSH